MASALLLWQQNWTVSGLVYRESWTEAFTLGQSGVIAGTGRSTLTGDLFLYGTFDIGSGTMATTGRSSIATPGLDYMVPDVHYVTGDLNPIGRSTITGTFDFEEPFFIDPPLELTPAGRSTLTGTIGLLINKSIGTGSMTTNGRIAFAVTTLQTTTAVVKPLLSVTLTARGLATLTGNPVATTVKTIGAGLMVTSGRSAISQSGFSVQAPAAYTHPIGTGLLTAIGDPTVSGDPLWTDFPSTELGSVTLGARGLATLSVGQFYSGGPYHFGPVSLDAVGRTTVSSRFSLPGVEYPNTEAIAVYEGTDMQEAVAKLEGDDIVV